jgi:hypothetical protein
VLYVVCLWCMCSVCIAAYIHDLGQSGSRVFSGRRVRTALLACLFFPRFPPMHFVGFYIENFEYVNGYVELLPGDESIAIHVQETKACFPLLTGYLTVLQHLLPISILVKHTRTQKRKDCELKEVAHVCHACIQCGRPWHQSKLRPTAGKRGRKPHTSFPAAFSAPSDIRAYCDYNFL